jgi:hypothetical protein
MYGCVIQLCLIRTVRMYKSAGSRAREEKLEGAGERISASIEQAGMDAKVVELGVSQGKPSPEMSLQCKGSRVVSGGIGDDCARVSFSTDS